MFLVIAAFGVRWAYALGAFVALLSFPARTGFELDPKACELLVGSELALHSFTNYAHIILFGLFALISRAQFRGSHANVWAFAATLVMGLLLELAQGLSGQGHCRMRDLLPDAAGALIALFALEAGRRAFRARYPSPNSRKA